MNLETGNVWVPDPRIRGLAQRKDKEKTDVSEWSSEAVTAPGKIRTKED